MSTVSLDKYAKRRSVLPGLLSAASYREKAWMAVAACSLAFAAVSNWHGQSLMASSKLEASKCTPLLVDPHGAIIPSKPLSNDEISFTDGLVTDRLGEAVRCLRGLDPNIPAMKRCWERSTPMFVTDEAQTKLADYKRLNFSTAQQLKSRLDNETVEVVIKQWGKPSPKEAPGRYWLRWEERHRTRSGAAIGVPEVWSGEFDVELVVQGQNSNTWNPVQIQYWEWRKDVVGGS